MHPTLALLRAAHCRCTHHYFAIDALRFVQTGAGKRFAAWLLRYHHRYLQGAEDPDVRFRDFQNHVVHVSDGYWGGAPRVAHQWYERLRRYVREERFADAAHAAGVISHYFTDPVQPLHTAQTPVERVLHRPIEWTILQSYDAIYRTWLHGDGKTVIALSNRPTWLGEAILHAAKYAHGRYQRLIGDYQFVPGIADPSAGFDADGRRLVAELFGVAICGWARVLERIAMESELSIGQPLPAASPTATMLLAAARVPHRLWRRRVTQRREQAAIHAMVAEFARHGTVKDHLSPEVNIMQRVMQVHEQEKAWKLRQQSRAAQNSERSRCSERTSSQTNTSVIPFRPMEETSDVSSAATRKAA